MNDERKDEMSVLVTGGAGFIGSHIVAELLANGFHVTVLDNFSEGREENLILGHPRLEVVRGDIRDFNLLRRLVDHKTCVFHLAAMSRIQPSITDPLLSVSQNIVGTANVLEACRLAGVPRVVYSASSSAYGLKNVPPLREDMSTDCLNMYSFTKKSGEEMCEVYRRLYGMSTVSLRYFNVYGPRHQEEGSYATVIAIFMRQIRHGKPMTIVGDGTKRRDFTFVTDVVKANMMAMFNREATGTFNIGAGRNYSIKEVSEMVATTCGVPQHPVVHIEDRPAEALVTLADYDRAKELLGWNPEVPFEAGLKITHEYQKVMSPIIIVK